MKLLKVIEVKENGKWKLICSGKPGNINSGYFLVTEPGIYRTRLKVDGKWQKPYEEEIITIDAINNSEDLLIGLSEYGT